MSTRSGSRRSGMVIETVNETVIVPNEQQQQQQQQGRAHLIMDMFRKLGL